MRFGDGVEICDLKVLKGPHIWSKDGRCVCTTVDAFTVQHIANVATAARNKMRYLASKDD